jgi:3-hydroxyisobutyrate dehydrogenase-like beta-hydroxyacid dehydrogenase
MAQHTLGFIGVGRMGGRMAKRLLQAGHALAVFDTNEAAAGPLVDAGARRLASVAALASEAEIVFASLPTPPIVHAVALGPGGVVEGTTVKYFVDTSTTGAVYARRIAEGLAAKGITAVDCPVSGGLAGAANGTLAVMFSGPDAAFEAIGPYAEVFGKVFRMGTEPGQGQTMKLVNNLLSASAMAASSEAIVMAVKAGLDPSLVIDVLNAGTGRNSATVDKIPRFVIPRTFSLGFQISLINKDVRLCLEEADAMGVPMIVGSAVRQLIALTEATEGHDADMSEMVRTVERWAGVRVGGEKKV